MGKQRVKFTFPKDLVTQPIIYQLARQFQVVTNIRRADVRENMGWVVLELEGTDEEIEKGVNWGQLSRCEGGPGERRRCRRLRPFPF